MLSAFTSPPPQSHGVHRDTAIQKRSQADHQHELHDRRREGTSTVDARGVNHSRGVEQGHAQDQVRLSQSVLRTR